MVVCKFFQQGNCRFGNNCRYDHPGGGGGGGGVSSNNKFGALSGNRFGNSSDSAQNSRAWTLDANQIRKDLSDERPKWILSSYAPVKQLPASLFEENEYSPEEIRLRFYELASKGQDAQADQEALQLWSKADQDFKSALGRVNDIEKFMEDAEKNHPNRYDYVKIDGTKSKEEVKKALETVQNSGQASAFGAGSPFGQDSSSANPFSKPAASAFGQSAFGQNNANPTSSGGAFGQAASINSPFGKPAFGSTGFGQSAFGQPAAPAQSSSPFGQPAQTTAFGAPSAFGKQPQTASPFGQQSQASSAFGQTPQPNLAFGQSAQAASPFGQSNAAFGQSGFGSKPSPFGQSNQTTTTTAAFGQSGFGNSSQPATSSPFGQQVNTSSTFGNNAAQSSPFGSAPQQTSNPFGGQPTTAPAPEVPMTEETPTSFTNLPGSSNPFGGQGNQQMAAQTPQSSQITASPFGNANASGNSAPQPAQALTNKPSVPIHYSQTLPSMPNSTGMNNKLTSYHGQRVQYLDEGKTPCYDRPDGKGPEKIWYPEAGATAEVATLTNEDKIGDLQAPTDKYTDEVKNAYKFLAETGKFEPGKMPAVPPLREWINYNF